MQVNVQFLQQLQPEWSRFVTVVKQRQEIDTVSYHKLFDVSESIDSQNEAPKPQRSNAPSYMQSSSTRPSASTRHKGKEIAKPVTPQSESVSEEDSDPEQARRDKDMKKNLALLAKYFKKLYKPTNNNLRTSSNSRNKTEDTTPRYNNDNQSGQFGNQRRMTVAGARETVGSPVVQQNGIQCFNCKGFGHYARECRKPKRVKDYANWKHITATWAKIQGVLPEESEFDWLRKENDIDTMIEMGQTIKFFKNEFFITQSSDSNHSHVSTQMRKRIHGNQTLWLIKSTFKKAQSDKPCLYEIPYDTSDPANRFAPDGEDTVTLEKESRSKLDKDKVKPYNYTYQNSLYETFKPPSKAYLDQLERAKEIRKTMWRKTEKADFSNIYDLLLEECVSKDVTCSYLHSMSHLNANTELQCLYLHKVKECECLAQKLSKQTESVNKEVHNKLLKSFAKLEKHSISLELSLQHCKEQMKNNPVCKENASNVFRKEREQYHEIQDLKAQMQDKNMVINELKKLILLPHASRNTNPHMSKSSGVIHTTSVSRPQLKSYQVKDKVVPNISQVKFTKKEVEDNHRISSISKKTKSVTACNDSSNSRTSNANAVCADCGKCVFNSDHDACVSRYLKDVNARTKKPKFAPIHVWRSDSRNSRSTGLLLECPQSQSFSRWSNSVYADLEVAFRKTTCFVIELQGNDLLTGSRGI
ncbi:retrovirus-related pol polyprotein from transposon TNT 1-94 [Tanacetum coccineum]